MLSADGSVFDRYFTVAEERQLLRYVKQFEADVYARRDYWWMVFLRQTALRVSCLLSLTIADAEAAIRTGRLAHTRLKKRGKDKGSQRDIYANKLAVQALRHLVLIHREMRDRTRIEGDADTRPLLLSRNQKRISERALQTNMKNWCEKAGLDLPATPHWWRHTWAKRRLAETNDMQTLLKIQAHLDHVDLKTTCIYLQPDKESMQHFQQQVV